MELVRSVSGFVHELMKHVGRKNMHSGFEWFFCAKVDFETKLSEVVREEGDPFFDVGTGFKDKCAVIFI